MGVASSKYKEKEPKDAKPADPNKPPEPPKEPVYDAKVPIKFEEELDDLNLLFGMCNYTDKEGNCVEFLISCIRRDKELIVIAIDGERCFEKVVNCFEFEDLRRALDSKFKRGFISLSKIFNSFQKAIANKKVSFSLDDTQQNGKFSVEISVKKIRSEIGFRMKQLTTDTYEKVFECFVAPLSDLYFDSFQESEEDAIERLQKSCNQLEEKLNYLEYCKKFLEGEKTKPLPPPIVTTTPVSPIVPPIVEEKPSLIISASQISMLESKKSNPLILPPLVLKGQVAKRPPVDISQMTVSEVISILTNKKKKLAKSRAISNLDVDAFNRVLRSLICGKLEKKTTVYEIVKDTLETVKIAFKNRNKNDNPKDLTPSWDPQVTLKTALMRMSSWEFDVFEIPEKPMVSVGYYIFLENDLLRKFDIPEETLINFLNQVEFGYNNNPYHNSRRAVEVLQAVNFFIRRGELDMLLTDEYILATLVSAIILDFNHPGCNNTFQMTTNSYLSTLYNNRSVLENHHLTSAFEILQTDENNIFKNLSDEQYKDVRETIIQLVLATDMSSHAFTLGRFVQKLGAFPLEADFSAKDDTRLLLQMVVKTADVSYTFRETSQYLKWAGLLEEEFFIQGDLEKKMGFQPSVYGDRSRSLQRVFQRTYLSSISKPMLSTFAKAIPKLSFLEDYLHRNELIWPSPMNSSFRLLPPNIIEEIK